jgi:hypothetical protein
MSIFKKQAETDRLLKGKGSGGFREPFTLGSVFTGDYGFYVKSRVVDDDKIECLLASMHEFDNDGDIIPYLKWYPLGEIMERASKGSVTTCLSVDLFYIRNNEIYNYVFRVGDKVVSKRVKVINTSYGYMVFVQVLHFEAGDGRNDVDPVYAVVPSSRLYA